MGVTSVLDKTAWFAGLMARGIGSTFLTRDSDMIAMHILFLAYAFTLDVNVEMIYGAADVAKSHIATHIKNQVLKFQALADFYSVEVMTMCIELVEKYAKDSTFIDFVANKRNYNIKNSKIRPLTNQTDAKQDKAIAKINTELRQKAKDDIKSTLNIIKDNSFTVPSLFQCDFQYDPVVATLDINLKGTSELDQVCKYKTDDDVNDDSKIGTSKKTLEKILYDLI